MSRRMTTIPAVNLTPPVWLAEFLEPDRMIPGGGKIDPAQFYAPDSVLVTMNGAAIQGATSLTVLALPGPIPSGTLLDFGGAKLAITSADAAASATSITVRAIPTALAGAETARYKGVQIKTIPAGTAVGRTIAERDANTPYGPAVNTDDEIFLTVFDVLNADDIDDVELLKHNTAVKENYLPGWSGLASALKTALRAAYAMQVGTN